VEYRSCMSSAWFGLIGVVVGGFISTLWSWLAVIRQELSEAVVAARLVDEDLRCTEALLSVSSQVTAHPDAGVWAGNRVALARVPGHRQWNAVTTPPELALTHRATRRTPCRSAYGRPASHSTHSLERGQLHLGFVHRGFESHPLRLGSQDPGLRGGSRPFKRCGERDADPTPLCGQRGPRYRFWVRSLIGTPLALNAPKEALPASRRPRR
jgi:hypothetical protein